MRFLALPSFVLLTHLTPLVPTLAQTSAKVPLPRPHLLKGLASSKLPHRVEKESARVRCGSEFAEGVSRRLSQLTAGFALLPEAGQGFPDAGAAAVGSVVAVSLEEAGEQCADLAVAAVEDLALGDLVDGTKVGGPGAAEAP